METTSGDKATERPGAARRILRLAALASTVLLALALVGYLVRDRTRWLALLMYLPMVFVALFAIIAQLAALERRFWKRRMLVIFVSAVACAFALEDMRGDGFLASTEGSMRLLQWNVQWGRDERGWNETVRQIQQAAPDIVVLSEAPSDQKLAALCARLGQGWTFNVSRNPPGSRYWYAMAVASRWPMSEASDVPLPNGSAYALTIARPRRPMRVLAVDGMSSPTISRTPLLTAVAARGRDFDILAGDFNAVSRSVGFDAIEASGFQLASRSCRGWRGTFPARLPVYDIDHVWLRGRYVSAACMLLDSPGTNHRGQLVHVQPAH